MFFKLIKFLKTFDLVLLSVMILLFSLGVLVIFSTTFRWTSQEGIQNFALNQLLYGIVGLVFFFIFSIIDYRLFKSYAGILYILIIVFLSLVILTGLGKEVLGATRWIDFGFFQLQPSEIAKLLFIIVMAKYFSERDEEMLLTRYFIISFIYTLIPIILIMMQPDFGTAITFFVIWLSMILVSQVKVRNLIYAAVIFLISLPVTWTYFLKDYQKERVLTFLGLKKDPLGSEWNVRQAEIAIGSGRLVGRGLGRGPQSQLNFLPAQHTDFIFAVLAEELGFAGATLVIALFFVLLYRVLRTAVLSRDNYGMFIVVGIFAMFFFHIFVNVGMNLGILPVVGIPLPLLSYGGTSVIITFITLGIIQNIIRRHKKIDFVR